MSGRKVDTTVERNVITGMIVSDRFLKEVQAVYDQGLVDVPFVRTVAGWCLEYWKQYGRAPMQHIQDIFESHRRNGLPPEQAELIADYLGGLDDEYERAGMFNVDYLLDQAEAAFKARSLELTAADVKALLARGDVAEAERTIAEYKRVERPSSAGIEPLTAEAAIQAAFDEDAANVLFRLPGELGRLVGSVEREDFVAIMGPEKRGKTWWLMELAMRALRARCNVAFFGAGDMSEPQMLRRLHAYNARCSTKFEGTMKSPVLDCAHNQDDSCDKPERLGRGGSVITRIPGRAGHPPRVERAKFEDAPDYVPCSWCQKEEPKEYRGAVWHELIHVERLTWQRAVELGKKTARQAGKRLKLSCHPNSTLTVRGMEAILDRWEQEDGFIADVVVCDYADILAPEDRKMEFRHQVNETWKAGRALSQRRHCALIWATQADADSYDRQTLTERNFSEDKRKYGHVTKFITLNQTPDEKRDGVMRIGTMMVREDEFDTARVVTVLQNLRIGRPYLASFR